MKTSFLIRSITLFIVALSFSNNVRSQEGSTFKLDLYGGSSNPIGKYRDSLAMARNGYTTGLSATYFIPESGLGIGLDARLTRHPHQKPEPIIVNYSGGTTRETDNTYSSPLRFRYISIGIGPSYRLGTGRLSLDLNAKAGIVFQSFPLYTRSHRLVATDPFTGLPVSFGYDLYAARNKGTNAFNLLAGGKISYQIFRGIEIFGFADYQEVLGDKGKFVVEDLRNGQDPQKITIKMFNFGGGIRISFGTGYDSGTLSPNP